MTFWNPWETKKEETTEERAARLQEAGVDPGQVSVVIDGPAHTLTVVLETYAKSAEEQQALGAEVIGRCLKQIVAHSAVPKTFAIYGLATKPHTFKAPEVPLVFDGVTIYAKASSHDKTYATLYGVDRLISALCELALRFEAIDTIIKQYSVRVAKKA